MADQQQFSMKYTFLAYDGKTNSTPSCRDDNTLYIKGKKKRFYFYQVSRLDIQQLFGSLVRLYPLILYINYIAILILCDWLGRVACWPFFVSPVVNAFAVLRNRNKHTNGVHVVAKCASYTSYVCY